MPELPEVETVARDLRRHLLPPDGGPRPLITGARVAWTRTLRDEDPARFVEGVTGRRIEAVGRRGKQLVIDLDAGAFLTVHLKMTGQLFVVPASRPIDPYERLALALDDGRELRFRDIRKFGRVGLYGADDDPFDGVGPRAAGRPLHPSRVSPPDPRPARPPQAAARRPGLPRRGRQHLCGRGAVALEAPPAALGAVPAPARRARPLPQRARDPGGGGGAAGIVDRRLHRPRRRRGDAGAPRRLSADGSAVPALWPADPSDRRGDPVDPLLLVLPAAAVEGTPRGRDAAGGDDALSGSRRWRATGTTMDRARRRGRARADNGRGNAGSGPFRADEAVGSDATGRGARQRLSDQPVVMSDWPASWISMLPPSLHMHFESDVRAG